MATSEKLLVLRGTTYHARLDVPEDVRGIIGKRVYSRSLRTSSLPEAKMLLGRVLADWRAEILQARGKLTNSTWKVEVFEDVRQHRETAAFARTAPDAMELESIWDRAISAAFPNGVPEDLRQSLEHEKHHMLTQGSPPDVDIFNDVLLKQFKEVRLGQVELTSAEREVADVKQFRDFLKARKFGFSADIVGLWIASLDVKTIVKRSKLRSGKTYIKWLQTKGFYPTTVDNPFDNQSLPKVKRKETMKEPRLPFETIEVGHIFKKAVEAKDTLLAATIAIAAYTGMRAEEIAQIKKSDIQEPEENKYIINVRDVGTKTKAGIRAVPVHNDLYPLILFLDTESKSEYLLDYETESRIGKRSVLLVTRFSKLKRALEYGKEKTFHSLRHSLATQLERAEIPENIAADILGHKKTTMSYGLYSGGTSLAARLDAINKIEGFHLRLRKIVPQIYFESA
ncbi:tyrosine-type recombinase/integrase [Pseudomonas sp. BN411]|uniref:tyrosine-type recombinase/integrase n=1 Tax=Pseudomonas sp. BN411 TaxID=2567887 RepID=UPI002456815E|nr:tyrosine-type recombinase/integrase [Pseudomonas sp. BN411]MDH4562145.1 hypothetical protein [Pseudomonas sp. BN411]